jgi:hypothetical protein
MFLKMSSKIIQKSFEKFYGFHLILYLVRLILIEIIVVEALKIYEIIFFANNI